MGRHLLIYDGTGSVEGGNCLYMMVLGLYRAYWLVLGGTWSAEGGTR